ncbi:DUF6036 family nucleotidyltransferase [Lentibacillus juripiscarius]|uniref:DUF6036 family nucleotidyltransferase n=1 Tax=Lentibacillus juripiscarius TaxID=257446 RepID=A0ABW5V9C0_9BACI
MTAQNQLFRATRDIDVEVLTSDNEQLFMSLLKDLNIHVVGGVMEVPPSEDFRIEEHRFELDAGFSNIRVYVPEIEMLACAKIFSTREKDLIDLKETTILDNCDKGKLLRMVEEYRGYHTYPENPDLNVHQLFHIFSEKRI